MIENKILMGFKNNKLTTVKMRDKNQANIFVTESIDSVPLMVNEGF